VLLGVLLHPPARKAMAVVALCPGDIAWSGLCAEGE
jgi:hypothetical protein